MVLECCSFEKLAKRVKENSKDIIMFGAGAIGSVVAPEILNSYGILDNVRCYTDNDKNRWGSKIEICGRSLEIHSPECLRDMPADTVILLNISRFSEVLEQLEQMECTKGMSCFIMPMMLIHNYCSKESGGALRKTDNPMIPKKLHYMHFGGRPLSEGLKRCMESWERFCPDYEIILWNEDNYDITKHPYMKQAYEQGAYGFVPDYARLDILYNEGGFYLDTDVEIIRSIEELRYQEAFCGVEKWQLINFGGLSGAIPKHPMVKKFLDAREDIRFIDVDGRQNRNTCGYYDTRIALLEGYRIDGTSQSVGGMSIYAYDHFQPYDYMSGISTQTVNTYSIHHFNGGWMDEGMRQANEDTKKKYIAIYERALANSI